jgi:hypothetical protein
MRSCVFLLGRTGMPLLLLGLVTTVWAGQTGPLPSAPANRGNVQPVPAQGASGQTSGGSPANPGAPASGTPAQRKATSGSGGKIEVPTGTHIPLVLHNAISTRSARVGDPVYFETLFPVMAGGRVVIPAGSYVSGEITEAKRAGRIRGRAQLMIKLTTMILPNAYMVDLTAVPSSAGTGGGESVDKEGKVIGDSDKASDAGTVVKTTATGAGIGAIAARSGKGAGIGAGVGAAAGLAAVLFSRGPEAEMPRGTTIEAVLDRPLFLDADKVQFTSPGHASTLPGPPNREPRRTGAPF